MAWTAVKDWADPAQWPVPHEYRPTYVLLPFLEGWTAPSPDVVSPLLIVSGVLIMVGLMTRVAAALFTAVYAYTFALDPLAYNNHYVLIALFGGWLVVLRSHAIWSADAVVFGSARAIPMWHQGVLRFQLCVVYFYGGLAKLNSDWLRAEPIGSWLWRTDFPLLEPILKSDWAGYFVAWYGLVFDLTLPFLLLCRRTRWIAIVLAILFHLTNSVIFSIGVFPWLGIGSLVLFLDPDTPQRWSRRLFGSATASVTDSEGTSDAVAIEADASERHRPVVAALLVLYAAVQLVVPFRHLLYGGYVEWTEEGKNLSWRMMLSYKMPVAGMEIVDGSTGRRIGVDLEGVLLKPLDLAVGEPHLVRLRSGALQLVPSRLVSPLRNRRRRLYANPRLLARYARLVADDARSVGIPEPEVRVTVIASLNGRPFQFLVDPDVDLAAAEQPLFSTPDWIVRLEPDQPIGDYPASDAETMRRVREVIARRQRSKASSDPR